LRSDLRRAFLSPRFCGAALAIVALCFLSMSLERSAALGAGATQSVSYLFHFFVFQNTTLAIVAYSLGVAAYGHSFCADYRSRFVRFCVIRSSAGAYASSRVVAVALSTFAAVLLGYACAALLLGLQAPLTAAHEAVSFEFLFFGGVVQLPALAYLLLQMVAMSVACSFWAVFALYVSSVVPNVFVVYAAPVVAYWFTGLVSSLLGLPSFLRIGRLAEGLAVFPDAGLSLLYSVFLFIVLTALFGLLFCRSVRKRLGDG
jgi:hypothetical protein